MRVAEVVAVTALATMVTAVIAAPVLRAPSERVFGMEIVGRHHDPFTVMEQFARPISVSTYSQPVTDVTGALLTRIVGPVAAYNWVILVSFPLAAAAAYALARHLAISPTGAAIAAIAYAFSPFHVAHAAYHPHIAQTQWIPLYLLALWRCLDRASPAGMAFLGAAAIGVTLSNFYGGLIAAVITPVAVASYWLVRYRADTRSAHRLAITVGSLLLIAALGMAYASYAAGAVVADRAAFAFPRTDLFRYSAKWWSYLIPPIDHPMLGTTAARVWTETGVHEGLLEQQVSLGFGIVALGLIAICGRLMRERQPASLAGVPVLIAVAVTALVCSLSPERTIGAFTFVRPSAFLYHVVPMFRSYARFGVVVQLMAALLAGIGVDRLRRVGTTHAQIAWVALVILAVVEYAVSPSALWRDALPTTAHRWVMQQDEHVRVLDCVPLNQESESVQWLTHDRVRLLSGSIGDCTDPNLPRTLAANGYTHMLVRHDASDRLSSADRPPPDGFRVAARFDDGQVFAIAASTSTIYTAAMRGLFPREHDPNWSWRWMGADMTWTIVNTGAQPIAGVLDLELSAFHHARRIEIWLDGLLAQTFVVERSRRMYRIGPITVSSGGHELVFQPSEPPMPAGELINDGDRRRLSFAMGRSSWSLGSGEP
jgi:hypothetical protein